MKCMFCKNPATLHQTVIVNQQKRETHLCERCARERGLIPTLPGPQIDLKAVLNLMLGAPAPRTAEAACAACGLTYTAFKASGRFSCRHDYDAFRDLLLQLFEKVHRGTNHRGKHPRTMRDADRTTTLANLHAQLNAAVLVEDYEEAARLRDLMRRMESEGTRG